MSSTRRAQPGSPLSQERFLSSRALRRGLMGNAVARRTQTEKDHELRSLLLFIQDLSHRDPAGRHSTCNHFDSWPWPSEATQPETAFERLAREMAASSSTKPSTKAIQAFPAFLELLCLDPAKSAANAELPGWPGVVSALLAYQARFQREAQAKAADTETTRQVWDALNFALAERNGLYILEGRWRTGKSFAAQAFAQGQPGLCRYTQLTSALDEHSFFTEICRALGLSTGIRVKTTQLRTRIESTLRDCPLLLILDEAHNVWPQLTDVRAFPHRAAWIMSALLNAGLGVALIAPDTFSTLQANVESKMPNFGMRQWKGRTKLHKKLPAAPTEADLFALAERLLPGKPHPYRLLAVGHSLKSDVPLAGMESMIARSRYFASQEGRPMRLVDMERAMMEAGTITDLRPSRGASAVPPRASRETAPAPSDRQTRGGLS